MSLKPQTAIRTQEPAKTRVRGESIRRPVQAIKPADPVMLVQKTVIDPRLLSPREIMRLHRLAGNQAVQRILAESNNLPNGNFQRKARKEIYDKNQKETMDRVQLQSRGCIDNKPIQYKVNANSFKEVIKEQNELSEDQLKKDEKKEENKEDKKLTSPKFTTVGFECEFATMKDGELGFFTHVEVGKSKNMFYKKMPFILETDAGATLELVTPPFLVETLPDKPVPLASDLRKINQLMEKEIKGYVANEITIEKLIKNFKTIDIDFELQDAEADWRNFTDINKKSKINEDNATIYAKDISQIKLGKSEKHEAKGYADTQINFATDTETYYDLLKDNPSYINSTEVFTEFEKAIKKLTKQKLKKNTSKGLEFFTEEFARTISGLISLPYANASVEHKKKGFAGDEVDEKKTYGLPFSDARKMASRVKDVKNVWIKDTFMNVIVGSLTKSDLIIISELLNNKEFTNSLQEIKILKNEDELQKAIRQYIKNVIPKIGEQVKKAINGQTEFTAKKQEFMDYEPQLIGARQDTYIPFASAQMPLWKDKRLHVVESRDTAESIINALGTYEQGFKSEAESIWDDHWNNLNSVEKGYIMKADVFQNKFNYKDVKYRNNKSNMLGLIKKFNTEKVNLVSEGKLKTVEELMNEEKYNYLKKSKNYKSIMEKLISNNRKSPAGVVNYILDTVKPLIKWQPFRWNMTRQLYINIEKILK